MIGWLNIGSLLLGIIAWILPVIYLMGNKNMNILIGASLPFSASVPALFQLVFRCFIIII